MAFGVFIHRSDSIYDDSPAERYQFPAQYLSRAQPSIGDWILYHEPRKVAATRGYFAVAFNVSLGRRQVAMTDKLLNVTE